MAEEIVDRPAYDEATSIVRDPNHPQHARYMANDPLVADRVKTLYGKAVVGMYDTADDRPMQLRDVNQAGALEVAGSSEVENILQAQLGSSYNATISDAVEGLGEVFGSAENFEAALTQLNLSPAQQAQGIKLLAEIGRRGR